MKKYLMTFILAAGVGGLFAHSFDNVNLATSAHAQSGEADVLGDSTNSNGAADKNYRRNWQPELAQATISPPLADARSRQVEGNVDDEFTPEERVNIDVYERTNRAVVNITTRISRGNSLFSLNAQPAQGSGSGSVIDREGHILTNYHVIEDAQAAMVTLYDGQSYSASLVGLDPPNDIAVLKIDAPQESLFPIDLGRSNKLRVGQRVFAIGNPFGLERTLTIGILSSLNRSLPSRTGRTMKYILQIDAALNRGNSGGPLLDSQARLIGMNTAIASPSGKGENTGIGFAIPASTLRRVVPELIENGRVTRADPGIAQVLETRHGLVIAQLTEDGPAEQAGLKGFAVVREQAERAGVLFERTYLDRSRADIVVAVDGVPIKTLEEFLEQVEKHQPGETTRLTVIRNDRQIQVPVVLGTDA